MSSAILRPPEAAQGYPRLPKAAKKPNNDKTPNHNISKQEKTSQLSKTHSEVVSDTKNPPEAAQGLPPEVA